MDMRSLVAPFIVKSIETWYNNQTKGGRDMAEEITIPITFIETELPKAPPLYVSIFLMTQATKQNAAEIAKKLQILESDVLKAWQYWAEKGYQIKQMAQQTQQTEPIKTTKRIVPSQRPDYTQAEINLYMKHKDIQALFRSAERKLGKTLSYNDMSMLFSFYDWLGLPFDVIELLLTYCVSRNKRGMRYIEQVAIAWMEEGIDTAEKAAQYLKIRTKGYREILRAFGQGNRMPVPEEEKHIKKWLWEYRLPLEVVVMACERTVSQTGGVSFAYADRILSAWKDAGVKNKEDVSKLDEAFVAKKAQQKADAKTQKAMSQQRQNRFINYTQREWDYAELERLEQQKQNEW